MNKKLDCVEIQHKGAEKVRKKIIGMTQGNEFNFWQERSTALKEYRDELVNKYRRKTAD